MEGEKQAIDRHTLRLFWKTGLLFKRDLLLSALYPIGHICLNLIIPLIIGRIIASLSQPHSDPSHYLPYLAIVGVVGILANRYGFTHILFHQARTMGKLQHMAMDTLLKRSTGFHNNNVGGKLVSDAIDLPSGFGQVSNAYFINLLPLAISLVVGAVLVFMNSWILGLVITGMVTYALVSGILDSRRRMPLRMRRLSASKVVTSHLADTILNVQTVKTFAREGDELARHEVLNHKLRDIRLRDWKTGGYAGNRRVATLLAMQFGFVLVLIHLVQNDPSLLAVGVFAFSFTVLLGNRLFDVSIMLRNVEEGLLQASPMTKIMYEQTEIQDKPGAKELQIRQGGLDLESVTFNYDEDNGAQRVFRNFKLSIKPGEKLGLVGPSGGGKSTLTRLLLRFEDITEGSIAIDDQNIADVTQESLRQHISYVPQEPLLFHRTIRENIAYGRPDATDEELVRAAKLAHAHDFIQTLTKRYDTVVGERGVKLSGGQRQRIAIARAVLKNAPILILDEATSALDSESEKLIQAALWELMKDRTAVVIAHRLSTIQKMDRIVVLDEGRIVEEGTHKKLLSNNGLYAKLWSHQSGGFIEG